MVEPAARQLVEGGWNMVWCSEKELELADRFQLRALLTDPLLDPASLDDPDRRAALDRLIDRVKPNPALFAYHLSDEPSAANFPALAKLAAHLRERDPAHAAYVNLLPMYATNEQLGVEGEPARRLRRVSRLVLPRGAPADPELRSLPLSRRRGRAGLLPEPRAGVGAGARGGPAVPEHRPGQQLDAGFPCVPSLPAGSGAG